MQNLKANTLLIGITCNFYKIKQIWIYILPMLTALRFWFQTFSTEHNFYKYGPTARLAYIKEGQTSLGESVALAGLDFV